MTDRDVIESMCLTWRHDFGLPKDTGSWGIVTGLTDQERDYLRAQMRSIYEHHVRPAMEVERQRCADLLLSTAARTGNTLYARAAKVVRGDDVPYSPDGDEVIDTSSLSVRIANALVWKLQPRLVTLNNICSMREGEWLRVPNFGRKSLKELVAFVGAHGRFLGDTEPSNAANFGHSPASPSEHG